MNTSPEHSISSILFPSLNSSPYGVSADIFFKGCKKPHCKGCHNKELLEFSVPNKSTKDIVETLRPYIGTFKVITLMGGEPLDRDWTGLLELIFSLREEFPDKKLSIYTKYKLDDLLELVPNLIIKFDYVKCGRYEEDNRTEFGSFLASKNQRFYRNIGGKFKDITEEL